jgi:hypothetical protein
MRPKRKNTLAVVLLLLVCFQSAFAGDIVISGPTRPVEVREPVDLPVTGLSDAELPKVRISVTPDGARVTGQRDWQGRASLQFWARSPGKYTITLGLNEWRRQLDESLFAAKQAGVSPELLTKHEALLKEYSNLYPFKSGSCVVEVAGVPFPPPIPPGPGPHPQPDPEPIPTGQRDVALIYESGAITERQASLNTLLRTGPTAQWMKTKGHRLFILDPDGKDQSGRPSPITSRFITAIKPDTLLPAIVILDRTSGAVCFAGSLDQSLTADGIAELIKRHGG